MTIAELLDKHYFVGNVFTREKHAKISVEFAISVLEDIISNYNKPLLDLKHGLDKIQELKQYLDEKV